jgi:hypothetical protein
VSCDGNLEFGLIEPGGHDAQAGTRTEDLVQTIVEHRPELAQHNRNWPLLIPHDVIDSPPTY